MYNQFDVVELRDGSEVTILEIYNPGAFLVEAAVGEDRIFDIRIEDIVRITYKHVEK